MHPASPSSAATDDSDAAEGLPLPPSHDPATDRGEVRPFPNCLVTEGSGVDPEGPEALPSTGPLDPETERALPARHAWSSWPSPLLGRQTIAHPARVVGKKTIPTARTQRVWVPFSHNMVACPTTLVVHGQSKTNDNNTSQTITSDNSTIQKRCRG